MEPMMEKSLGKSCRHLRDRVASGAAALLAQARNVVESRQLRWWEEVGKPASPVDECSIILNQRPKDPSAREFPGQLHGRFAVNVTEARLPAADWRLRPAPPESQAAGPTLR
ncbi:MAG: hypothetical protein F4X07_09900 [Acidimicrobiaceae bacterium]|nr:hypothetical protein [Acidimicrobiaceae bacterium]